MLEAKPTIKDHEARIVALEAQVQMLAAQLAARAPYVVPCPAPLGPFFDPLSPFRVTCGEGVALGSVPPFAYASTCVDRHKPFGEESSAMS